MGGRQLTINWNLTDQPEDVAKEFALKHDIPLDEIPMILDFVKQANDLSKARESDNKQMAETETPKPQEDVEQTPGVQGPGPEVSKKTSFDLSFPVEVADGRQLTINWNFDDQPEDVAKQFVLKHEIPLKEIPSIWNFIHQINSISIPKDTNNKQMIETETPKPQGDIEQNPKPQEANIQTTANQIDTDKDFIDEGVKQLMEMGFGEQGSLEELRSLLVDCGGDVEQVVQNLLQH